MDLRPLKEPFHSNIETMCKLISDLLTWLLYGAVIYSLPGETDCSCFLGLCDYWHHGTILYRIIFKLSTQWGVKDCKGVIRGFCYLWEDVDWLIMMGGSPFLLSLVGLVFSRID